MNKIRQTSLALLLLVIIDASGDAFRLQGWQIAHHVVESFQIAGWVAVWALFDFNAVYIIMYILGRFVFFDLTFNVIMGNEILYVGPSSLYGRMIRGFADLVHQHYIHFAFILKMMAGAVWAAWFFTTKQLKEL